MKVSIVILNWNGEKFLNEYLPSIIKYCNKPNYEVVVADNNSTDNSINLLKNNFPQVKIIILDQNYGFAKGYNLALNQIESDYFILCNSDIELKSDAVTPLIKLLEENQDVAVAMPKIKSLKSPEMFEYAGAAGGFIDMFGYPFCRGRILENIEPDNGQYNLVNKDIFWASGAFMAVKADIYKKCGGLDDNFFAHMEEIDFCWRVKNLGMKVLYCAEAEVFHLGGGTLNQGNPHKLFLNYRNSLKMLYKNLSPKRLLPILWFRMCLDGISAIIYLCKLQFSYFIAVIKAHFAFYFNLPTLIKQRKQLKKIAVNYNHKEIYNGSIVYNSIIKKKKTFFEF
ncbi:MAG: glycosyltransferase family 2 protein [Bacteroidales bacterium]|nr:glycosyltransferase family 2 protein [Bacteroidales bacterium]